MRTFQIKMTREMLSGHNGGKASSYTGTTLLNYRFTEEKGVEILGTTGWRKSMLRIDALLNLEGLTETTESI